MNFTMTTPSNKQALWALMATGSVVLTGLVAGSLIKYRDDLRDHLARLRKPTLQAPAGTPGTAYEEWTKADLYERARDKDISGRSTMNKAELVEALRAA